MLKTKLVVDLLFVLVSLSLLALHDYNATLVSFVCRYYGIHGYDSSGSKIYKITVYRSRAL